jgi:hypothetical protein
MAGLKGRGGGADRQVVRTVPPALTSRRGLVVTAIILVHLAIPLVTLSQANFGHDRHALQSDAHRFQQIALEQGTPGRDFRVEYPPLAVLGMRAIGHDGLTPLMQRLVWLNALADLAIALALWWGWSKRASIAYLAICAPLLAFLVNGFDLIAVAVAIAGLACSRHGRQVLGGVLVATAAFVKVWPALLIVVFLMWRHRRAVAAAVTSLVAGGLAWIAWSGIRGPIDVATFRGARGWHVESTVGVLVALFHDAHSRYEAGAWRVGNATPALGAVLTAATAIVLAAWFWRWRARIEDAAGAVMVGALAIVFLGATLFSPQYLVWGAPFAAIAWHSGRRRTAAAYFTVVMLDVVYVATNDLTRPDLMSAHVQVLVRNLALVGVIVVCARELYWVNQARRTSASTSTYAVPLTSTVTECNVPVKGLGAA